MELLHTLVLECYYIFFCDRTHKVNDVFGAWTDTDLLESYLWQHLLKARVLVFNMELLSGVNKMELVHYYKHVFTCASLFITINRLEVHGKGMATCRYDD